MSYNNSKTMYLSAYMKKSELIKSGEHSNNNSPIKIKTLAKIVDPPEKLYEHTRGAVIGGIKSPTKATVRKSYLFVRCMQTSCSCFFILTNLVSPVGNIQIHLGPMVGYESSTQQERNGTSGRWPKSENEQSATKVEQQ